MNSCKFLKPGILTTVQDSGRPGLAYYAIPSSGPMDRSAAQLANTLVGNETNAALIEFNLSGGTIHFNNAATIAVTGADMNWQLNGKALELNQTTSIEKDAILKGSYAKDGQRGYLAIKGHISGRKQLGSYSTYGYASLGYNNGKPILKDHILEWESSENETQLITLSKKIINDSISIYRGPEYDLLTGAARKILTKSKYSLSADSNRMGARLKGAKLEATRPLTESVAVLPGFIQLTPSGQPIVILQDGQTTGGYPRIAYIKEEQLGNFNQLKTHQEFTFRLMD